MPDAQRHRPNRRELLALGVGAFVVASIPLAKRRSRRLVRRRVPVMGTIADVGVVSDDGPRAQAALDAAIERLRFVDRTMTWFDETSDVGRANCDALRGPVPIGEHTATVVESALRWADASSGFFDPCLGRAMALWDVLHRTTPPAAQAVRPYAARHLYRALEMDSWRGRPALRFHDEAVDLDLGGIAKGYGVDLAVEALRDRGFRDGLVNVGGDLYALGRSEDGDPWRVGIQSPVDPGALAGTIEVADEAVATSGDYVRCFRYHGRRYHHLLDPDTASPRNTAVHSVTVAAARTIDADAGATAAFVLPREEVLPALRRGAASARLVSVLAGPRSA